MKSDDQKFIEKSDRKLTLLGAFLQTHPFINSHNRIAKLAFFGNTGELKNTLVNKGSTYE